jgi:ATP-dependent Clp protease ATP-binding subunit ClpX
MTDEQLLDTLRPCLATVDAMRQVLQAQIDTLRKRGVSWAAIGDSLGVTRQAAWERFS